MHFEVKVFLFIIYLSSRFSWTRSLTKLVHFFQIVLACVLAVAAAAPQPGVIAGSPLAYAAPGLIAAPGLVGAHGLYAAGPAISYAAAPAAVHYAAPATYSTGSIVTYHAEPVEQHGYKIAY